MATAEDRITREMIDEAVSEYDARPGSLLGILEQVQLNSKGKYLSQEAMGLISKATRVPLSTIYSVATFYSFFNLKPQGEHTIVICRGTACHTRRSKELLDSLNKILEFREKEFDESEKVFMTTKDNKFTVKTVACFGQCALAPIVEIDGTIYGHVTEDKLKKLINAVQRGKKKK